MTREEREEKVHQLYDELMEAPRKILQIFEDFFDESNVDMQGYPSFEDILAFLDRTPVRDIFGSNYEVNDILNSISEEQNLTIDTEFMKVPITSKKILMEYVFPKIKRHIDLRKFNDLYIIVHFPSVRVTNEYGKYVDIQHLYAKVPFYSSGHGKGYFGLNRAEYPAEQFVSDYMHSHVSGIPITNLTLFPTPCTGTGPINSTLSTLSIDFEEAIWQLFCVELDKYVRVESIAGVPHHRLENIGRNNGYVTYDRFNLSPLKGASPYFRDFSGEPVKNFIEYLLKSNKLKFNFRNGSYGIAMSPVEYAITVSDVFIEWANKRYTERKFNFTLSYFTDNKILNKGKVSDGKIYLRAVNYRRSSSDRRANYEQYIGQKICTFKGKDVNLVIKDTSSENSNEVLLLNLELAEVILNSILLILNSDYGRETGETSYRAGSQKYYI